jgi:4'-phosphopantetheinyl transferase EntD
MPLTHLTNCAQELLPKRIMLLTGRISSYQSVLTNEEMHFIQQAGKHRVREFIAGRSIAKEVMTLLGGAPLPIGRDDDGCPLWPSNMVGSISHKGGLCGALIADSALYNSVGFDIEFNESLEYTVWKTFANPEEIAYANECDQEDGFFANILFSSKEAHFKALYPLLGRSTPFLNQIKLIVKKQENHIVTMSEHASLITLGGVICDSRAVLAWAYQPKNV